MHIDEAILGSTPAGIGVMAAGAVAAAAGVAIGLRRLDHERMPRAAMLAAAFFVASTIHVPLGVAKAHLVLTGLLGLVLGWAAFPAVLVALALQAVFLGYGGFLTLGVNTLTMAGPAVVCHYALRRAARSEAATIATAAGFAAGVAGTLLGALVLAMALTWTGEAFAWQARLALAAHLPLALVEGFVTAGAVGLLRKVRPELLHAPLWTPTGLEISDA
jgi:cobalt/nickel transport system permease protein